VGVVLKEANDGVETKEGEDGTHRVKRVDNDSPQLLHGVCEVDTRGNQGGMDCNFKD